MEDEVLANTFEYSPKELENVIEILKGKNLIKTIPAGNGYFVIPSTNPLSCDSVTGMCNI